MPKITDETKIKELQEKFENKFSPNIPIPNVEIVHQGVKNSTYLDDDVLYSQDLDMWFCFSKHTFQERVPRYWNGFGLGKPKENSRIPPICEINFPKKGETGLVKSFFFVDDSGKFMFIILVYLHALIE